MKKTNTILLAVFAFCCVLAVSCNHDSIIPPQEEVVEPGPSQEVHEHTFSTLPSSDKTHHWYDATCEHKDELNPKSKEEHDIVWYSFSEGFERVYGRCSVCDYEKSDIREISVADGVEFAKIYDGKPISFSGDEFSCPGGGDFSIEYRNEKGEIISVSNTINSGLYRIIVTFSATDVCPEYRNEFFYVIGKRPLTVDAIYDGSSVNDRIFRTPYIESGTGIPFVQRTLKMGIRNGKVSGEEVSIVIDIKDEAKWRKGAVITRDDLLDNDAVKITNPNYTWEIPNGFKIEVWGESDYAIRDWEKADTSINFDDYRFNNQEYCFYKITNAKKAIYRMFVNGEGSSEAVITVCNTKGEHSNMYMEGNEPTSSVITEEGDTFYAIVCAPSATSSLYLGFMYTGRQ